MRRLIVLLIAAVLGTMADASEVPQLVDITEEAGISWRHSIGDDSLSNIVESTGAGCAFLDYDGDGDLDLYLVNGRFHPELSHARGRRLAGRVTNALYRNNGDGT